MRAFLAHQAQAVHRVVKRWETVPGRPGGDGGLLRTGGPVAV